MDEPLKLKIKRVCRKEMRNGKLCRLMEGHKGSHRHDSIWYCDGCGLPRSGTVTARTKGDDSLSYCFVCVTLAKREAAKMEQYYPEPT
jgi:hypothetical protein